MRTVTLNVPKDLARARYLEYREAARKRNTAEDRALARGYRALAQGKKVIDLVATLQRAGQDDKGRPRLAIVRADAKTVWLQVNMGGTVVFACERLWSARRAQRVELAALFPRRERMVEAMAVAPVVPPRMRPAARMDRYHLLWEPEWQSVPPAKDPLLLRHLHGSLYVVVAAWDTTPLEQAVLRGRL